MLTAQASSHKKNLLITFDFPPIVSGISTVFYYVWRNLNQDRFLILAPKTKDSFEFDKKNKIKVIRKVFPLGDNIINKILRFFMLFFYLLAIVRKEKIDFLVCGQPIIIGSMGLIFKKLFKLPYHVFVYGGEIIKFEKNKVLMNVLNHVLCDADKIITNSNYTTNVFLKFGIKEEKIVEISPAVDAEHFKPGLDVSDLKSKFNLEGKKVLTTISRLVARKGNDTVINALPDVISKASNVVYLIVGNGPHKPKLESLVKSLNLKKHVIFAGFVSDSELPRYYNLCDVYVMPNRATDDFDTIEGFGLSFIEASACAKPVIGGKSGGALESVKEGVTGFLVDPLDVEDLADKIINVLTDKKLYEELASNGRKRVLEEFLWKSRSDIFRELMSI